MPDLAVGLAIRHLRGRDVNKVSALVTRFSKLAVEAVEATGLETQGLRLVSLWTTRQTTTR